MNIIRAAEALLLFGGESTPVSAAADSWLPGAKAVRKVEIKSPSRELPFLSQLLEGRAAQLRNRTAARGCPRMLGGPHRSRRVTLPIHRHPGRYCAFINGRCRGGRQVGVYISHTSQG